MKNILIFAALAGIASAIAIYFVTEFNKFDDDFITDVEQRLGIEKTFKKKKKGLHVKCSLLLGLIMKFPNYDELPCVRCEERASQYEDD